MDLQDIIEEFGMQLKNEPRNLRNVAKVCK